jgi:hypothetical protein
VFKMLVDTALEKGYSGRSADHGLSRGDHGLVRCNGRGGYALPPA